MYNKNKQQYHLNKWDCFALIAILVGLYKLFLAYLKNKVTIIINEK